jgi:hypothetical protein
MKNYAEDESAALPANAEEAPEASVPEIASDDVAEAEVVVYLAGPFYLESFTTTTADGGTLVLDRKGTLVLEGNLKALHKAAANNGVSLRVGK